MNAEAQTTEKSTSKAERVVEKVAMDDGREVEFVGKQKAKKESLFDDQGHYFGTRFDFRDGRTFFFELAKLPHKLIDGDAEHVAIHVLAAHGVEQKLGDSYAGKDKISDMFDQVEGVAEQIYSGRWSKEREANEFAGTSILARALSEANGKPIEVVKAFLKTKTPQEKKAMRNSERLRAIIQRLEAEEEAKSTKKVDTEALFGELDSLEAA